MRPPQAILVRPLSSPVTIREPHSESADYLTSSASAVFITLRVMRSPQAILVRPLSSPVTIRAPHSESPDYLIDLPGSFS